MNVAVLTNIVSLVMFFVKLFVGNKARQQEIADNMNVWFGLKVQKGSEIADQMTDLEQQEEDLKNTRGSK